MSPTLFPSVRATKTKCSYRLRENCSAILLIRYSVVNVLPCRLCLAITYLSGLARRSFSVGGSQGQVCKRSWLGFFCNGLLMRDDYLKCSDRKNPALSHSREWRRQACLPAGRLEWAKAEKYNLPAGRQVCSFARLSPLHHSINEI